MDRFTVQQTNVGWGVVSEGNPRRMIQEFTADSVSDKRNWHWTRPRRYALAKRRAQQYANMMNRINADYADETQTTQGENANV